MNGLLVSPSPPRATPWTFGAYAYGLVVVLVLAYFLFRMPVQVSDSFGNLLAVQGKSVGQMFAQHFSQEGYLRPLLWAEIAFVYQLAEPGGTYYVWFRGLHVAQVLVLVVLCVRLMRPRSSVDAALVVMALSMLIGSHTFAPVLREAFPINSYLTVLICCAAAANLSLDRRRRGTGLLACVLLTVASLTMESGLLVWVVCASLYLLGAAGVSRRAVMAMTALVAMYFVLRFWAADVGAPGLGERASGFGFHVLEPADLVQRFGAQPLPFYVYNIVASLLTVLFSEPKGGVYRFLYEASVANVTVWTAVGVLSSTAATALVVRYLWLRRGALRTRAITDDDRLILLYVAVLVANASISYPYTKNIIMSPAGMFLAIAVFAALRHTLQGGSAAPTVTTTMGLLLILAVGSAYRTVGTHYNLRYTAGEQANEWARVDEWLARQHLTLQTPAAVSLRNALQREAIWQRPPAPRPAGNWSRWFDIDW